MPAFGFPVYVLDYEIYDADTYDKVIEIQVSVAYQKDIVVFQARKSVIGENVDIRDTVQNGDKEEGEEDMALIFTGRQIPASRRQYDHKDGYSDQIGNVYGLQVDRGFHVCPL